MIYFKKHINILLILIVFLNDWSTLFVRAQDEEEEDEDGEDHGARPSATTVKLNLVTTKTVQTTARVANSILTTRTTVQTSASANNKVVSTTTQKKTTTKKDDEDEDEEEENPSKKSFVQETSVKTKTADVTEDLKLHPPCPAIQCVKNPKNFDEKGELIVPVSASIGKFHQACGTKILLSNKMKARMNYSESERLCCQHGMRLASPFLFDTKEKQKCFQELFKKYHADELLTQYRISGMDSGSTLTWCSSGVKSYRNSTWETGLKVMKLNSDSKCVMSLVSPNSITLQFSPCNSNVPFMCEDINSLKRSMSPEPSKSEKVDLLKQSGKDSSCTEPYCLTNTCSKTRMSSSSFAPNGTFLFPENKIIYREGCGGSYILDMSKKFFPTVGKKQSECCIYGMRNINIESMEKLLCLDQLFTGFPRQNYEFITRATDFKCPGKWSWCDHLQIPMDPKLWISGELPTSKNGCSVLQFSIPNKSKAGIKYASCLQSFYYMCENLPHDNTSLTTSNAIVKPVVQSLSQVTSTTVKPKIMAKNCKHICSQVPCNSTSAQSQYLTPQGTLNLGSKGIVVTACGIKYIFAFKKQDMNLHMRDCCEFGMRAAEFETAQELTCLETKFKEHFKTKQSFITRGSSLGCAGTWRWCDAKTDLDPALWLAKQPAADGCAVLELNPEVGKRSGLTAVPTFGCANKLMFICKEHNSAH